MPTRVRTGCSSLSVLWVRLFLLSLCVLMTQQKRQEKR